MSTKKAIISLEDNDPQISIIVQLEGKNYPYGWVAYDYKKDESSFQVALSKSEVIKGSTLHETLDKIHKNIHRGDVVIGADLLEIATLVLTQKQRSRESAVQHGLDGLTCM